MLKKGKIFITVLLFWLLSCNDKDSKSKYIRIELNNDLVKEYQIKNFHNYKHIYDLCNDSLMSWRKDSLSVAQTLIFYPYQLDSAFCFNSDSNRFISTINIRNTMDKDKPTDMIQEFGGAKINNQWYFFFSGASMAVLREYYKDSTFMYKPFSFEELSWIAHTNIHKNAIKKNNDGSFSSNDLYFENKFNDQSHSKNIGLKITDHDSAIVNNAGRKYKYKLTPKDFEEFYNTVKQDNSIQ